MLFVAICEVAFNSLYFKDYQRLLPYKTHNVTNKAAPISRQIRHKHGKKSSHDEILILKKIVKNKINLIKNKL